MKKKEKQMIGILIIVAIIIIAIIYFATRPAKEEQQNEIENEVVEEFVQVLDDGTRLNISEELKEEKTIEGIKITNIQLTEKNGQTMLLANATNTTEQNKPVLGIYIIILDKQGNEIVKIPGAVSPLKAGETKQLNINITENYANAYDFRVEKQ